MSNATVNPGYCNILVSNNGFLCTKPRMSSTVADTIANMPEINILGSLNPWYSSRNITTKKNGNDQNRERDEAYPVFFYFLIFLFMRNKEKQEDNNYNKHGNTEIIIELPAVIFSE